MAKKYPESEKAYAVREQSQVVGEFIDWLQEQGYSICEYRDAGFIIGSHKELMPTRKTIEQWLCEFFKIDQQKYEQEKEQMAMELADKV